VTDPLANLRFVDSDPPPDWLDTWFRGVDQLDWRTPPEQVRRWCAALALLIGLCDQADWERLLRLVARRTGIGLPLARKTVDREIDAWEHQPDAPRQRVRTVLPDYPGPDIFLPFRFLLDPEGRVWRKSGHGLELVSAFPVFPALRATDADTGDRWLVCALRRPSDRRWVAVLARRSEWRRPATFQRIAQAALGLAPEAIDRHGDAWRWCPPGVDWDGEPHGEEMWPAPQWCPWAAAARAGAGGG
jgi:hypothetical protein